MELQGYRGPQQQTENLDPLYRNMHIESRVSFAETVTKPFDEKKDAMAMMDYFTFNPDSLILTGIQFEPVGLSMEVIGIRVQTVAGVNGFENIYKISSHHNTVAFALGKQRAEEAIRTLSENKAAA